MAGFIARQPNGLLCRHSTVVDCVTDYNMTEEEYIRLRMEQAKAEAEDVLKNYLRPFEWVEEYFEPNNMTRAEFKKILQEMELPADQCKHKQT